MHTGRCRFRRSIIAPDCQAVEGLPLTMIIVMVILAITIPLIFGSLRTYDRERTEAALISEIDSFITAVQLIYVSGPGNGAVIEFEAKDGSFSGIDTVTFGDSAGGSMASVVRYILSDGPERMVLLSSPNVPMMSEEHTSFEIMSGSYDLLAECVSGIEDLNGDGIRGDIFIRLTLA